MIADAGRGRWRHYLRSASSEGGDRAITFETELERGGAASLPVSIHAAAVDGGDGELFFVCQLIDLSDRVALTEQARDAEDKADHDSLTGLLNRRGAERRLQQMLVADRIDHEHVMAVLIDCDEFKQVNDTHGYAAGDALLREIAKRIRAGLRPNDLVARVGGDEFLAVLAGSRLAEAAHVANNLRRLIADKPIPTSGGKLNATISVGVVPVTEQASVDDLVSVAGKVLKRSKKLGRDRVSCGGDSSSGALLQEELDGLVKGLETVRQSVHRTDSGDLIGFEFLSRGKAPWRSPAYLFDVFRRHDRLESLDVECLERGLGACRDVGSDLRCHLNLFPSTLLHDQWPRVMEMLADHPNPGAVCLELSEQQFVGPSSKMRSRLAEIRKLGFRIGLDDVGFGRSALETLIAIEPDVIKIDRGLIARVEHDAGRRRVLERLVTLLSGLNSELVAEGVESDAQRALLEDLGVPFAQGFLWCDPDVRKN